MTARILVVDDDENMRDLLRMHLGNAGYEVRTAADGIAGARQVPRGERIGDLLRVGGNLLERAGTIEVLRTADEPDFRGGEEFHGKL